ncbi:MAG: protein phosphatase 2C domain-containing protein [Pirellula sp.]|jgi:protein phosphatase|nr:protein phosphatase 2C domain-containing protein [Pirellula sp.]
MSIVSVRSAGLTHCGSVRDENQDQYVIAEMSRTMVVKSSGLAMSDGTRLLGDSFATIFLVADGMGGHVGGREASRSAIEYFLASILNKLTWVESVTQDNEVAFRKVLEDTLSEAHRELQSFAEKKPELKDMGTTLTMAYVTWPQLYIVHAGDTRCYLYRDRELKLITRDHTVAQQMMMSGRLKPNEGERSPWSNVLVNALGAGAPEVVPDLYCVTLNPDDRLLLCSDGLNKHVSDERIAVSLSQRNVPEETTGALVKMALEGGGSDNVTVLVADFLATQGSSLMRTFSEIPTAQKVITEFDRDAGEVDTSDLESPTPITEEITLDSNRRI